MAAPAVASAAAAAAAAAAARYECVLNPELGPDGQPLVAPAAFSEEDEAARRRRLAEHVVPVLLSCVETLLARAPPDDYDLFHGLGGHAMLMLLVHQSSGLSQAQKNAVQPLKRMNEALARANDMVRRLMNGGGKLPTLSFVCGAAGVYALSAVCRDLMQDRERVLGFVDTLLRLSPLPVEAAPANPTSGGSSGSGSSSSSQRKQKIFDEILYGRAGYITTLLFVRRHLADELGAERLRALDATLDANFEAILESGRSRATDDTPLMWVWHEAYLGGAHGVAGILFTLLSPHFRHKWAEGSAPVPAPASGGGSDGGPRRRSSASAGPRFPLHAAPVRAQIKATLDFVLRLRLPSGNYPSNCSKREKDRLVQFCHGAPGVGLMFCRAYEALGDDAYLRAARDAADFVWRFGILQKGSNLCHGIGGNAYLFLYLYRITREREYLRRAHRFADFLEDLVLPGHRAQGEHARSERCGRALVVPPNEDFPASLFAGLGGGVYFLIDLLDPLEARFPALDP